MTRRPRLCTQELVIAFAAVLMSGPVVSQAWAAELPTVEIQKVRRVYHNGEHNAFTDLCRFRDRLYLTFRSCPDGHMVHPTSTIRVLSSLDGETWEQVQQFHVPKRDCRDPHFLQLDGKLFVMTGTWYCGETSPKTYDMNQHLGFACWTEDGQHWNGPQMLEGTYGHYVWRAAEYQGKGYLCGRRKHHFVETSTRAERDPLVESALLESDDGFVWRTANLFQSDFGDETAFRFTADGGILAVARSGGGRNAQVCRADSVHAVFQRTDLDRYIGGPLLVNWKGHDLVGGRDTTTGKPLTTLFWLTDNQLHKWATLPSGGDNSYPGFVTLDENRALLSWYSSHEQDAAGRAITAIYLAELLWNP